jgi:hypothetical protein
MRPQRWFAAAALAALIPLHGPAACGPFTVIDCTLTKPQLVFVAGNTHTKADLKCTHRPNSISVQIRTQWRNKSAGTWDLVSKFTITLANLPRPGHTKHLDIVGLCYAHTRERVHVYGHAVSDTGQYNQESVYAPNKYGKRTYLCDIAGGH